jgi:hypothetical protein
MTSFIGSPLDSRISPPISSPRRRQRQRVIEGIGVVDGPEPDPLADHRRLSLHALGHFRGNGYVRRHRQVQDL